MFLRENSNNVVLCHMDMDVLLLSSVSCFNIIVVMVMAGSTATDVSRAFTS